MGLITREPPRPRRLPDYYRALGVPEDATFQEIQAAYWERARRRRDELPLLNQAYEVLGDAARRQAYDAQRSAGGVQSEEQEWQPPSWPSSGVRQKLQWFLQ